MGPVTEGTKQWSGDSSMEDDREKYLPFTAPKSSSTSNLTKRASTFQPGNTLKDWEFFVIFISLCFGLFLALMDISIISTALYTISVDFSDYQHTVWAASAYILVDVACAAFFTRLSDVYGKKALIITSFFLYTMFSLAAGFAQSAVQLIIFRSLQGLGGTGLYSLTMVICPTIAPVKYLPVVIGGLGLTIALAGVCGPVLGGVITSRLTWRWIFWVNVPFGYFFMAVLFFVWPASMENAKSAIKVAPKLRQVDFIGFILNATSTVLFVVVLQQIATRQFAWSSGGSIACLYISGLSTVLFYSWQWYIRDEKKFTRIIPQLPFRMILNRPLCTAFLSALCIGFLQFNAIFSIPLRAQIVNHLSPISSGLHLLPLVSATACGSILASMVSRVKNYTFYTMAIGTALGLIGAALLSSLPEDGRMIKAQFGYEVVLGLGTGMTISTATFMTNLEAHFLDHAVAQGTVAQCRILGGALGIATSTLIMNKHIASSLSTLSPPLSPSLTRQIFVSPFTITTMSPAIQEQVRLSYIGAFREDMRIAMCVSAVALVISLCAWQKNPPTVQSRKEEYVQAVKAFMVAKLQLSVSSGSSVDGSVV